MNSTWLIWLLSFGTLLSGATQQYILGVPTYVAESAGVDLASISLMMTAFGLVNAIFAPIVLIASGKFTQRWQLVCGLMLVASGMFITSLTSNFGVLLACRGLMGVGSGVFVATAYSMAPRLAKPGRQGAAMSNVALGFSMANLLAMPTARALADIIDWHIAYAVLGFLALVLMALILKFIPPIKASTEQAGIRQRLTPLRTPAVLCAMLGTFLEFTGFLAFYTYLTPFLELAIPSIGTAASVVLFIIGIMSIVGTKLCGILTDRIGPEKTIIGGLLTQAGLMLLLGLLAHTEYFVAVLMCLWAVTISLFVPAQNFMLARIGGKHANMAISLSNSFLQLGNGIGGAVAGLAITFAPLSALPFFAAPVTLLALFVELAAFRLARKA